jgi:hypothetical protein
MGDENAGVLSKRSDIPQARFFEFEYQDEGRSLGTVAITLDEDDGMIVQLTGDIANKHHAGAFKFIRGLRSFAKDRLINFDVQNIAKDQLDKRDYEFQSKPKEEPMEPMMESKMYGTARISYQDLGEAKLIVKHSQPVNPDVAAGRTMHIEGIWVENSQGERFKYPVKHLNGARALAEHLKHGGYPWDNIGKHITGLSEELAQLRKFKGYVGRNAALSEAMGDITDKVMERIEAVKKEVHNLQRPAYYQQFAESFEDHEDQMIPEDIMSDWIDRLTIRTFNEDLKSAFPYIFRLVDESSIPVKELTPEDILGEADDEEGTPHSHQAKATLKHLKKAGYSDKADAANIKPGTKGFKDRYDMLKRAEAEGNLKEDGAGPINPNATCRSCKTPYARHFRFDPEGDPNGKITSTTIRGLCGRVPQDFPDLYTVSESKITRPEDQFESFMDSLVNEDEDPQLGDNTLFSPNKDTQRAAIDKFNEIMKTELKGGPDGINILDSLKGLIDDPEFLSKMKDIDPDLDARGAIQQELNSMGDENPEIARILPDLNFKGDGSAVGGEALPPEAAPPAMPPAAPEAAPAMPPAAPDAGAVPPAPEAVPPAPIAENQDDLPWHTDDEDEPSHFKKPHNPNRTGRDSAKALSHAGLLRAIQMAKKAGAGLDTKLDFGHKEMTLHDCIRECGLTPMECGFEDDGEESGNPVEQMLKSVAGFWNKEERNFTIGGTRCKVKIIKDFKNGEFKGATPEDVKRVVALIDKMDPSSEHNQELGHIKHLSGIHGMHPQAVEIEIGGSGQINPHDMMKSIIGSMNESDELTTMLKIAGLK